MVQLYHMTIYFSGISGVGIGPLAELAKDAGYQVFGSDIHEGLISNELRAKGIDFHIGAQDGTFLQKIHNEHPIDWFVHTSALPVDNPELLLAEKLGIKTSKRDAFLSGFITEKNLKLLAIAGTSGKTTTTSMLTWAMLQLNIPVSYLNGSTVPYGFAGHFDPTAEYIVYECDEFDRNFLAYRPFISLITSLAYDHVEIYPTEASYYEAFRQFANQSLQVFSWQEADKGYFNDTNNITYLAEPNPNITLPGPANRRDASLVLSALESLQLPNVQAPDIVSALNTYPGTHRRFEKLAPGLYTDYAHLPAELKSLLELAGEVNPKVALVYSPLQNERQYHLRHEYKDTFLSASKILWLPTYQIPGRETNKPLLTPEELIQTLSNSEIAEPAGYNELLINNVQNLIKDGYIVVVASGGSTADNFFRKHIEEFQPKN